VVCNESHVVSGCIPDERAMTLTVPSDELSFRGCGGVFFPPQARPKVFGSLQPYPPYFCAEDLVEKGWVYETQPPHFLWFANFFSTYEGHFASFFSALPEKAPLDIS